MSRRVVVVVVFVLIAGAAVAYLLLRVTDQNSSTQNATPNTSNTESTEVSQDNSSAVEVDDFDAVSLQSALNEWLSKQNGLAGIVVTDRNGRVLASVNPDMNFFAASIYKLYVAYEGYLQVDRGDVVAAENYVQGNSRGECLDLMIRESDSPCAEAWWAELGREELTAKLQTYGLKNTDMSAVRTTAADAAVMLSRIVSADELSEDSKTKLLTSMREQIYDATFDKVFTEQTVYNKIGFRDYDEYHDVAIIELQDGRMLVVAALTDGVGTQNIRALGESILSVL